MDGFIFIKLCKPAPQLLPSYIEQFFKNYLAVTLPTALLVLNDDDVLEVEEMSVSC